MENTFPNKKLILKTDFLESNIIDSAEKQLSYLIITETGKHLKVSPTSYFLLASFNKGVAPEQIAETLNVSVEKVNSSYESLTKKIEELDENESSRRTGFWFLWEIIPSSSVEKIARPLALMFHPFAALLACTLISISIFLNIQLGTFTNLFSSIRNPESFWIGYLLFLLSILVHEFGHAAASVRYGAVPSGIGFTLYLIFPALYSDVTTSWKLKSRQRAMVGLGGIYFQLIAAAVYTLLGIFLQTAYFEIAVLMIFGNCLLNLNPVFKFDGYWILSDLLGVVNLHRQPKQIFLYLYNRVRGRAASSLPWLTWISLIIGIYSIGSIFIIGFFILRYSSHFWSLIQKYPAAFQHFFDKLFSRESVSFVEIHTFFLSTIPLVILIYFFYNVVFKALIKKLKNNSDQIK